MSSSTERLAVFDFDNTIVKGDTGTMFAVGLIFQNPLRAIAALALAPIALPLFLGETTRRYGISIFYWTASVGKTEHEWQIAIQDFVRRYLARPHIFVEALRAVERHRRQGDSIIIATGCFERLAQAILREGLGVHAEIVASSVRRVAGGYVFHEHCFGLNKLAMLRNRIANREITYMYSDSAFDLSLLVAAKSRFVVNAGAYTRRQVQRFAAPFERLVWRQLVNGAAALLELRHGLNTGDRACSPGAAE